MIPHILQSQIEKQIADTKRLSLLSTSLPAIELPPSQRKATPYPHTDTDNRRQFRQGRNTSTNFTESEKDASFVR